MIYGPGTRVTFHVLFFFDKPAASRGVAARPQHTAYLLLMH